MMEYMLTTLGERKSKILEAVIDLYIRSAEPVGSKAVADTCSLGVSSATIRSEMAILEEMGLLVQPHTSAGRVPTDQGYRYYVDGLRERLSLAEGEAMRLQTMLSELRRLENEDMMRQVSSMLSNRTCAISLVMSPGDSRRIYFWGISQLLHQPEFGDVRRVEILVDLLEGDFRLADILSEEIETVAVPASFDDPVGRRVHVRIGSENRYAELAGMSLVAAEYSRHGEPGGIVGLIGPTRMDYGTAIPMVDFTARSLSRLLGDS